MADSILCLMGLHRYDHCLCTRCWIKRDKDHLWEGCKCRYCGKTRDEGHQWDGCKCTVCGRTRNEGHQWNGCKCTVCGKTRDEGHVWDGCICTICGKARDEGEHDWDGCKCRKCGRTRSEGHILDASTIQTEFSSIYDHKILKPIFDRTVKCARCGTELFFKDGRDYCPKCFHEMGFALQYTDSPTIMKSVYTCKNCGYRFEQEFSDSY